MASKYIRFPFPMRVGTDICSIQRIARILNSPLTCTRFIKKLLTDEECSLQQFPLKRFLAVDGPRDTNLEPTPREASFLAGRFAAKEAAKKAHGPIGFHDIIIRTKRDGRPIALIRDAVRQHGTQFQEALLSISHDGEYATAVCIGAARSAFPAEVPWPTDRASSSEEADIENGRPVGQDAVDKESIDEAGPREPASETPAWSEPMDEDAGSQESKDEETVNPEPKAKRDWADGATNWSRN